MSRRRLIIYVATAAALTFNNWLLGIFINHRLFMAGGSVSEFSATTQPYHWLFRSLDIASGVLLVILAFLIFRSLPRRRYFRWLSLGLAVLGLANCLDAALPLPCSGTLSKSCNAPVRINLHRVSLPDHVFSSTLIGICYILVPLAVFLYARRRADSYTKLVSLAALSVAILFFVLLVAESFFENSLTDHLSGYSEELQMLVLGWLIIKIANQTVKESNLKLPTT